MKNRTTIRSIMRSRIIVSAVALAAISATLLAGCSPAGKDSTQNGSTSATLNLYQHPQSFNPLKGSQGSEVLTDELIFDNLVQATADFKFEPRLASSWKMSDDGLTWTFHLRKNLKWSDGKPFSADDVVWTFDTYADPEVGSAWATKFANVEGYADFKAGTASSLSGITAPDKNTVVITFAKPAPGFLASIVGPNLFILPKHILGSVDKADLLTDDFFNLPKVGMGPYVMTKFTPDQEVDLKKNPHFREPVGIDKLYLKMLTSEVAEAQLQTGELDLAQVAPADLSTVQGMQGVNVSSAPSAGFLRIVSNDEKFPAAVRQALLTAIDRKTLIKTIYGGKADLVNSSFLTKWALPDDLNTYEYDQAKAKSMLQASGFDFSKSYSFEWVAGTADRDQAINVILQEWQAIGVNIRPSRSTAPRSSPTSRARPTTSPSRAAAPTRWTRPPRSRSCCRRTPTRRAATSATTPTRSSTRSRPRRRRPWRSPTARRSGSRRRRSRTRTSRRSGSTTRRRCGPRARSSRTSSPMVTSPTCSPTRTSGRSAAEITTC
jgi:peptide/nickel transport system substrate-binding protein